MNKTKTDIDMNPDLEEEFLTELQKDKILIWIYLLNGIRLIGTIHSFNDSSLFLSSIEGIQLVRMKVISTIVPQY